MEKYIIQVDTEGNPIISYSADQPIDADTYGCTITLTIHPIDGIADDFVRNVYIVSKQSDDGYKVDDEREAEIQKFLTRINK